MDWISRMNNAIDYIEINLADEISYDKAAQIAYCSTYHFQRMFSSVMGWRNIRMLSEKYGFR